MEHLIEENRARNGACRNVGWLAADASTMDLPADSQDIVFSNWLLMYLSDAEVAKLAADALQWVRLRFDQEVCLQEVLPPLCQLFLGLRDGQAYAGAGCAAVVAMTLLPKQDVSYNGTDAAFVCASFPNSALSAHQMATVAGAAGTGRRSGVLPRVVLPAVRRCEAV